MHLPPPTGGRRSHKLFNTFIIMKKILSTAALALALAASAGAATNYELGSTSYTMTTGLAEGQGGGSYSSFSFTLSNSDFSTTSNTATTTNILTQASDGSSSYASEFVALTSISVVLRNSNSTTTATTLVIKEKDSDTTVLTSTSLINTVSQLHTDIFDSSETATRPTLTFTFSTTDLSGSSLLEVGKTYTAYFVDNNNNTVNTPLLTSHNNRYGSSAQGHYHYTGTPPTIHPASLSDAGFQPAGLQINTKSVTVVPEPATATLSLLALAGLAARRRRK